MRHTAACRAQLPEPIEACSFFWDHELNSDPRVLPMADSLAELDDVVRSPEEPDGVLGGVEWVDPDFEETFRTLRE